MNRTFYTILRQISFTIFFVFTLVYSSKSFAQTWEWSTKAGGLTSDKATTLVTDEAGNSYVTGFYNESADFGPFHFDILDIQSKEAFIAKVSPTGEYLWVKKGQNHYDDRGLGVCLDPAGNVYITGTCWGGITFGSLTLYNPSNFTDQIFVLKLDNNGNEIWLKNAGVEPGGAQSNDDHGHSIASDNLGNLYVTGFLSSHDGAIVSAQFDAINVPVPAFDSVAFLAKLSNAGVWQWVKTFGGEDGSYDNRMAIDESNNVYITGSFRGVQQFGTTTLTSIGGADIFVTKYDENGNFLFAKRAGSSLDDRGNDLTVGFDGNVYVTGEFRNKAGFDLDSVNNYGGANGRDIFVAKMKPSGEWVWAKKAGSTSGSDRGCGIVMNTKYNIFVCGQFRGKAKFGGNDSLVSGNDSIQAFVASIDTTGKWQWALQGGGPGEDRAGGVGVDTSCNVYTCGYYNTIGNFGDLAALPGNTKKDIFVAKIKDPCSGDEPPNPPIIAPDSLYCNVNSTNLFTPNGDGKNDLFEISTSCNAKNVNLVIINRWGVPVFKSNNPEAKWNGTDNGGNSVSNGVYFYNFEYEITTGKTERVNGFITITE